MKHMQRGTLQPSKASVVDVIGMIISERPIDQSRENSLPIEGVWLTGHFFSVANNLG